MSSLRQDLIDKGYVPEQDWMIRKVLSTVEKGQKYRLEGIEGMNSVVFQVDGKIIATGSKCDKLVIVEKDAGSKKEVGILVELKGKDVMHAVDQLEATLKYGLLKHSNVCTKKARIVASAFPSSSGNLTVEKAKVRFLKNYHCELKTLKSMQPDKI